MFGTPDHEKNDFHCRRVAKNMVLQVRNFYRLFIDFCMPRTSKYVVNTIVSLVFAFYEKVSKIIDFGIHFGIIFGAFWHQFSTHFRHRFLDAFLDAFFSIFDRKWWPMVAPMESSWRPWETKWRPKSPKWRPFWPRRRHFRSKR